MKEKSPGYQFYDNAFHEIFSHPEVIQSLLLDFVGEPWVKLLDFSSLKVMKSTFKGISTGKRESDLMLTFRVNKQVEVRIIILLEFQRKSENMMLRLLDYLLRAYEKALDSGNKLPVIIPVVIYHGTSRWKERGRFIEYFKIPHPGLIKYIPDFEYILIDEKGFDEKLLRQLKSAAAYFFLIDRTDFHNRKDAAERIIYILQNLKKSNPDIFSLLGNYVQSLLSYMGVEIKRVNSYLDEGGKTMFLESLEKLKEESIADGRAEGLEQGLEEGRHKGIEEGRHQGIEQGMEQGIEQGMEQGIEQGIAEGIEKGIHKAHIETASRMLAKGYAIREIVELTGFSAAEINKLKTNSTS